MNKEQTIAYFNDQIVRMEGSIATMSGDGELKLRLQRSLNAYKMAIKALEQQPCEDCISREEVQDLISRWLSDYLLDETREALETINYKVGDMPSVKPERPKGKWINDNCSICGYGVRPWNNTPYCPNCGAKMGGADETN